jgi:hypothetical protein
VQRPADLGTDGGHPALEVGPGLGQKLQELLAVNLSLLVAEDAGPDDHVGGVLGHRGDILGRLGHVGGDIRDGELRHLDLRHLDLWHRVLLGDLESRCRR